MKWSWLLMQCAMPIMASLYLARNLDSVAAAAQLHLPQAIFGFLFIGSIVLYMVFWLIAESLLCMCRFPLDLKNAFLLVGGFVGQFAVLAVTGESLLFAAYAGLYATLAALLACALLLLYAGLRLIQTPGAAESMRRVRVPMIVFPAVTIIGLLPLVVLWPPLWSGFINQSFFCNAINIIALAANVFITVRTMVDFSVFGRPDPRSAEYDKEWAEWAPQTIGLLILAVVTATTVAGLNR